MVHDRIHAREPTHDPEKWRVGTIADLTARDGHCVVTVSTPDGESVELVVTVAVRELFVGRLDIEPDESPVGERVWFRKKGGQ
ncbi:DUF7861 family protein [Halorientalis litorea]|uniref:DUF7861 family protein n=1 Tax=Halorientalis litorea TaxID=2931977 RepID=UPI001FF61029|nr:hypothetical protein [Halorientalis litorea]